jgi:hypothetical protein
MRRFQKENSFSKIEKKIQVDSVTEFPSLSDVMPPLQNENKEKRNYVDMCLVEKEEEKKDLYLPGWMHISMDKNRKVKKMMNGMVCEIPKMNDDDKEDTDSLNKTEYNKKAVKVISEMIQNWENYKTWYTHLYGAECYEKMYEMVHREDDIFYDDNEYDENDNFNQDGVYTDEDDDY